MNLIASELALVTSAAPRAEGARRGAEPADGQAPFAAVLDQSLQSLVQGAVAAQIDSGHPPTAAARRSQSETQQETAPADPLAQLLANAQVALPNEPACERGALQAPVPAGTTAAARKARQPKEASADIRPAWPAALAAADAPVQPGGFPRVATAATNAATNAVASVEAPSRPPVPLSASAILPELPVALAAGEAPANRSASPRVIAAPAAAVAGIAAQLSQPGEPSPSLGSSPTYDAVASPAETAPTRELAAKLARNARSVVPEGHEPPAAKAPGQQPQSGFRPAGEAPVDLHAFAVNAAQAASTQQDDIARPADSVAPAAAAAPERTELADGAIHRREATADPLAASAPAAAPGPSSTPMPAVDLTRPAAAAPAAAGPVVAHVATAVGSTDWAPAVAQQIANLDRGRDVELNLNPAELGPLKVRLSMADSQAQVVFVSEHPAVRQALEAALPQLRASFADNGISLGHVTVGSGSGEPRPQHGSGHQAPAGGSGQERTAGGPPDEDVRLPALSLRTDAGRSVDTFA